MSCEDLELHGHSDIFFLGVNRSGPGTSSTTNHKFYRALGRLHGPRCKQPLRLRMLVHEHGVKGGGGNCISLIQVVDNLNAHTRLR